MYHTPSPTVPDYPPLVVIAFTLISCMFGGLVGGGILFAIAAGQGVEVTELLTNLDKNSSLSQRNSIRFYTMINHATTFILPALLVAFFLFKKQIWAWLKLKFAPVSSHVLLGSALMVTAFPLVQLSLWFNQKLPLPDWMMAMEDQTNGMLEGLLVMNSPVELVFNLILIAVLPALGEELIFRGLIQQSFRKWLGNPHVAIWLTAILFSTIHFQFQGFLPRMFLGALLGYLFYWTNNLWVPIIAHFVTNGLQVFGAYVAKDLIEGMEQTEVEPNWIVVIISSILVGILIKYFIDQSVNEQA